jgi:hypothetical protein
MAEIPFTTIDWNGIPKTTQSGETGSVVAQTVQYPGIRIRLVEYSAGYQANHWCEKGHIVHCLEGVLTSELKNGSASVLREGMTYLVTDGQSRHRSKTIQKVRLLIIDGDFLKSL